MKRVTLIISLVIIAGLIIIPFAASADDTKSERKAAEESVSSAISLLKKGVEISNSIPASVMNKAVGMAVIPKWTEAALIAGGGYGSGVLMAKKKSGEWSNPLFVSLTGGSFGVQAGFKSSDLILVFTDRAALEQVAKSENYTLGADASVSAGDTDKSKGASTKDAQIITYENSSGLFAGAALDGNVLKIQREPTLAYYSLPDSGQEARGYFGKDNALLYDQIIGPHAKGSAMGKVVVPDSAKSLRDATDKFVSSIKARPKQ